MKLLITLTLLLCTACERVVVRTAGGGTAAIYVHVINESEQSYHDDQPDLPYTWNKYGYCKTYIK